MATRKKKNNIGAFGHPIYGKGFAKYGEMRPNVSSETPNDLEEAAQKFADMEYMVGDVDRSALYKGFWHGAKWQAEQDKETIELAEDHAYLAGAVNEREQMMKDAVEWDYTLEDGRIEFEGDPLPCLNPILNLPYPKFKPEQKVKLIIVKEDTK